MKYTEILAGSDCTVFYTQSGKLLKIENSQIELFKRKMEKENIAEIKSGELSSVSKLKKLAILLNNSCNLRCRYCYMDYGNISGSNRTVNINLDAVEKAIENVYRLYNGGIGYIQFFGGEPLLDFEKLEKIVQYTNTLCDNRQLRPPNYGIVTNGIALTEDMVRVINNNDISVTISIDGPKVIHDAVRVNARGNGSFGQVKNIVKRFQNIMKNSIIYEMTINHEHTIHFKNGSVKEWMEKLKEIGLQVGIICIVENSKDHSLNITECEVSIVEKIYQEIVDYFIDELLSGKENIMVNAQIIEIIRNISNKQCQHITCGPGIRQLTFTAEGSVVPCTYMLDEKYNLGDFSSIVWKSEEVTKLVKTEFRRKCKDCWASKICSNFCYIRKEDIVYEGKYLSSKCLANLFMIKQVLRRMVMLQREGRTSEINAGIHRCNNILSRYKAK